MAWRHKNVPDAPHRNSCSRTCFRNHTCFPCCPSHAFDEVICFLRLCHTVACCFVQHMAFCPVRKSGSGRTWAGKKLCLIFCLCRHDLQKIVWRRIGLHSRAFRFFLRTWSHRFCRRIFHSRHCLCYFFSCFAASLLSYYCSAIKPQPEAFGSRWLRCAKVILLWWI